MCVFILKHSKCIYNVHKKLLFWMRQITINHCPALESTHTVNYCVKFWQWIHSHEINSKITKINSTHYTLSTHIHLFWMMHLYSALLCIVVHPKRFTIMWGGLSSTTTSVQHPLGNSIHHNPNIGAGKIPLHTCWERLLPYVQHSDQSISSCPALSQSEARTVKRCFLLFTCIPLDMQRRHSQPERVWFGQEDRCGRFSVSSWSLPFLFFYKYTSHPIPTLTFIKYRIMTVW